MAPSDSSFRGDAKHRTRNLEIPGLVLRTIRNDHVHLPLRQKADQRELLPDIKSPTLVIAGRHDMSTTIADGEFMRSRIPGASMTILDAAHISNVEQPHAFTDALVGFLTQR